MLNGLVGKKVGMSQLFDEQGHRIPTTLVKAGPCFITRIKSEDPDGYRAVQLGFGGAKQKNTSKPVQGIATKAGLKKTPRLLFEIRNSKLDTRNKIDSEDKKESQNSDLKVGSEIKMEDVFSVGDTVKVSGRAKGKGFAGVVKRWGFKGGPKTHGQSDRLRAPGSIGRGTTPGRVVKGKKMAGRMGGGQATVRGLKIIEIDKEKNLLTVGGTIPGPKNGIVKIIKEN